MSESEPGGAAAGASGLRPPSVREGGKRRWLWDRDELARELARRREAAPALRVVLANGCFDVLHPGHVRCLDGARSRGDLLVVALNSDASVRELKGPSRPLLALEERAEVLAALRAVDYVTWFDERDVAATLRVLRPDVHAKGPDYTEGTLPEAAVDRELGIEIAFCGDPKARSTSELLTRMAAERRKRST